MVRGINIFFSVRRGVGKERGLGGRCGQAHGSPRAAPAVPVVALLWSRVYRTGREACIPYSANSEAVTCGTPALPLSPADLP